MACLVRVLCLAIGPASFVHTGHTRCIFEARLEGINWLLFARICAKDCHEHSPSQLLFADLPAGLAGNALACSNVQIERVHFCVCCLAVCVWVCQSVIDFLNTIFTMLAG